MGGPPRPRTTATSHHWCYFAFCHYSCYRQPPGKLCTANMCKVSHLWLSEPQPSSCLRRPAGTAGILSGSRRCLSDCTLCLTWWTDPPLSLSCWCKLHCSSWRRGLIESWGTLCRLWKHDDNNDTTINKLSDNSLLTTNSWSCWWWSAHQYVKGTS